MELKKRREDGRGVINSGSSDLSRGAGTACTVCKRQERLACVPIVGTENRLRMIKLGVLL
jgi:hypothetical protein